MHCGPRWPSESSPGRVGGGPSKLYAGDFYYSDRAAPGAPIKPGSGLLGLPRPGKCAIFFSFTMLVRRPGGWVRPGSWRRPRRQPRRRSNCAPGFVPLFCAGALSWGPARSGDRARGQKKRSIRRSGSIRDGRGCSDDLCRSYRGDCGACYALQISLCPGLGSAAELVGRLGVDRRRDHLRWDHMGFLTRLHREVDDANDPRL
jgi:hypothetical protein